MPALTWGGQNCFAFISLHKTTLIKPGKGAIRAFFLRVPKCFGLCYNASSSTASCWPFAPAHLRPQMPAASGATGARGRSEATLPCNTIASHGSKPLVPFYVIQPFFLSAESLDLDLSSLDRSVGAMPFRARASSFLILSCCLSSSFLLSMSSACCLF